MNYLRLLLVISITSKHIIRNSSIRKTDYKERKIQLDIGDILLALILILEVTNLISIGEIYKLSLRALLKMVLAVISIILVNRVSLVVFIRRLKYFRGHPQISAGGVHHLIKGYKGLKLLALALITTASGPFLEELIFRAGLTILLSHVLVGIYPMLIQALVFGLAHGVPMYLGGVDVKAAVVCFIVTAIDGMILGYISSIYGILASWLCHWCVNFIAAATYNFNRSLADKSGELPPL